LHCIANSLTSEVEALFRGQKWSPLFPKLRHCGLFEEGGEEEEEEEGEGSVRSKPQRCGGACHSVCVPLCERECGRVPFAACFICRALCVAVALSSCC
jgi:hypothetical protein